MREIKFRFIYGVDGKENTYFSKVFTFGEIENGDHFEVLSDNPFYQDYSILAKHQFTGLLDKHGKPIFKCDVVRCINGHIGVVEWGKHDCCFNVTGYYEASDNYPTMAFMEGQPFEILGNIYEHPDLLNSNE